LGKEIWEEHYTPIIGVEQVEYMLNKFQSEAAIENQIKEGYQYSTVYFDGVPVGYLSIIQKENSLFLSKIYVLSSERGKGIGKFILNFIEQKAIRLKRSSISLTVNINNTNSIKAYEKMGFVKIGELVADIGNGFVMDDFLFEKKLS
jgi:ribosomal protein S18 acetylase RimI-like enzyme